MPRKSWWARLPFGVRMAAGTGAFLVLVGAGAAGVATLTSPASEQTVAATAQPNTGQPNTGQADPGPDLGAPRLEEDPEVVSRAAAAAEPPLPRRHDGTPVPPVPPAPMRMTTTTDRLSQARVADERADRTGPRQVRTPEKPHGQPRRAAAPPVVTTRTDVETRAIPFDTRVVRDSSLPRGTRRVEAPGTPGEQTLRYLVTVTDGRQTARRLLGTSVTKAPQERVVALGARRHSALDPACEQALNICLPLGRAAVCPGHDPAVPATVLDPSEVEAREPEIGEILISEHDLELLDGVRLEPATLC